MMEPLSSATPPSAVELPASSVAATVASPRKIFVVLCLLYARDFVLTVALFIGMFWFIFHDKQVVGLDILHALTPGLAWLHLNAALALTAGNYQLAADLSSECLAHIAQKKLTTASIELADFHEIVAATQAALVPGQP